MALSKIPIMYQLLLDRLKEYSYAGMLPLRKARYVLSNIYRVPKQKLASVLGEMHRMGLIKINGQRFVHILKD